MDDMISRAEHEEFCRRQDQENQRQNKRIDMLEEEVRENRKTLTTIERLAQNMENMAREQEKQGARLDAIESRDGEKWRKIIETVLTTIVAAVVGFALAKIGFSG